MSALARGSRLNELSAARPSRKEVYGTGTTCFNEHPAHYSRRPLLHEFFPAKRWVLFMRARYPAYSASWVIGCLAIVAFPSVQSGAEQRRRDPATAGAAIDFNRQIRPLLSENCFACHGPDENKRKAKLRLDTKQGAFAPLRDGGFAIVPGKPGESRLIERIAAEEDARRMPPVKSGKRLTAPQIDLLRQWIAQGAPWSTHWAFVAPARPSLPKVADAAWPRNAIDHFILARLEREHLRPSPEADKPTLIRRVTLDLTGLPPTPAEVDAFLADKSPEAYEKVVDRLLQSSHYGEHIARYWLDAARYGDTHGLHLDNYREMWPYRDWVIKAFNRNLSYDRFVIEQLAGDLLPNPTLDQLVATGFIRCHVTTNEGGTIEEEFYVRNVVDEVSTTGTVFLGLTVGCARCHDHKYDPVRQKDFYQLFAFFNSIDGSPLDGNAARYPPVARVAASEQLAALAKAEQKVAALQKQIAAEVAKVKLEDKPQGKETTDSLATWLRVQEAASGKGLPKPIQEIVKLDKSKRTDAQRKQLREYFIENAYAQTRSTFAPLHQQLAAAEKERDRIDKLIPTTLIFKERSQPKPSYILKRGEYDQKGEPVGRDTPAFLPPLPEKGPRTRLGLAQWLVGRDNPLTARVAVNHFWQQCFGTGIVKTAEDFGSQGEPPSHPELLDWLAVQFQEDGWDVKRMMKRIVMSACYRQSSRVTPDRLAKDPANRLLSRGPRFRLDAEMLRDQALALGGLLVEKVGGPSVKPPQPAGLWEAVGYVTSNTRNFVADAGREKVHRRSLYTFWKRTAPPPQMSALDAPSREECTVRRERTDTPLQALLLLNEQQYVECARALAERVMKEGGSTPEARVTYLFRLATARRPDARELAELLADYKDNLLTYTRDVKAAKDLINVGETKSDAKLNASELAAWTMLANLVLNLDEVINKG
jgi:mono/diheme cytochrome c family protein